MISKKKKIFILVGMVALLVVTGVLNIYLNANAENKINETGGQVYSSFFQTYAADRKATREQTILYLDAILENPASTAEELARANSEKLDIIDNMNIESTLEVQIEALGYGDVVITSSSKKVTIIIKAEDLTEVEAAQILHITLSETDKTASDVRIIPVS